jgi:hypothetical protein
MSELPQVSFNIYSVESSDSVPGGIGERCTYELCISFYKLRVSLLWKFSNSVLRGEAQNCD